MITGEPGSQCNIELQDESGINQTVTIDRMAGAGSCCPP